MVETRAQAGGCGVLVAVGERRGQGPGRDQAHNKLSGVSADTTT